MRRLPVFFLIDVSESMVGEPIKAVEDGLKEILRELRSDPYALETVYISVIVFAGKAKVMEKLTELIAFQSPVLPLGGGTSLGAGLNLLMKEIDTEVQPTTREVKGDWKPLIFLFTDGAPTDDPQSAVARWNRDYRKHANMVAISFGDASDLHLLGSLTDDVLLLKDMGKDSFRQFFKWVSASIQVSSMAVSENSNDEKNLDRASGINLEKADTSKPGKIDDNFVILLCRCSKDKSMFLGKYARSADAWLGEGAWRIDEETYKSLSDTSSNAKIDASMIDNLPACPVCGATSLVHCGKCGGLSCYNGQNQMECPWCGLKSGVQSGNDFSIDRAKG